ncbi:MAG: hypothetical protein ED557_08440 [Balneola sp.]|nr:MAG: hypothetical protein ED557_08440 [Balneola sp.]
MILLKNLTYIKEVKNGLILLAGIFLLLVFGVNLYFIDYFQNSSLQRVVMYTMLYILIPVLFFPILVIISSRFSLFKSLKNIAIHFILSIVYVAVFTFLVQFLRSAIDGYNFFSEGLEMVVSVLRRQFIVSGSMAFLLYWGIATLSGLQDYYKELAETTERNNELEAQLNNATLSALKAQLKPHFLFNTLNMVDFLIHSNPEKAISTLDRLEDLIKSTFDQNRPNSCTIEAEIDFLEKYLDIEKSRFPERLSIKLSIDDATKSSKIPCYLIQPLVENSIKHGVGKSIKKCTIRISTYLDDANLYIEVKDDGIEQSRMSELKSEKWGVGLKNIKERLTIYYGESGDLKITFPEEGGCISLIKIPRNKLTKDDKNNNHRR